MLAKQPAAGVAIAVLAASFATAVAGDGSPTEKDRDKVLPREDRAGSGFGVLSLPLRQREAGARESQARLAGRDAPGRRHGTGRGAGQGRREPDRPGATAPGRSGDAAQEAEAARGSHRGLRDLDHDGRSCASGRGLRQGRGRARGGAAALGVSAASEAIHPARQGSRPGAEPDRRLCAGPAGRAEDGRSPLPRAGPSGFAGSRST